jgi:RHS repeat-associated protein
MDVLKRAGFAGFVAMVCFVSGLATPYSTAQAQSSTPQVAAPANPAPADAPQSMASARLEAAARHMARITRELRGRGEGQPPTGADDLALAQKLRPHLAGLRSLDLVLQQAAAEDRADMDRLRTSSEMRQAFEGDEARLRQAAAAFRPMAERVEHAIAANSAAEADAALDQMAAELARTDRTRRPAFDPATLRAQQVKRQTRLPAQTKAELQQYLAAPNKIAPLAVTADTQATLVAPQAIPELSESEESRITPRIQALADELGHNPVRIYNWVHNTIDFVPGQGAVQGADLTLRNRQGNATDINSLLVALLRASGIPARFVYGTVDVPVASAVSWLRARDLNDALGLVQMGGIPSTLMMMNGQPYSLRLQHIWVEAFIDFTPSRGAINRQPDAWIPMDASFKQYRLATQRLDVLALGGWNTQDAVAALKDGAQFNADGSFTGLNTTAYTNYRNQVVERVAQSVDLTGLNDPENGLGRYDIVPTKLPVISGTLPFAVSAARVRYAALPASLKFYMDVQLYATQRDIAYENPMLSLRVATVALGGQSLYVNPKPATADQELALRNYEASNAASLPLGSFSVIPQVKLGDQVLAEAGAMRMGDPQFWVAGIVDLQGQLSGAWEPYEFAAGSHINLTPDLGGMTPELAYSFSQEIGEQAEQPIDHALHLAGVQYWLLNDSRADLSARGAGGHFLRAPSVGVFAAPLQVRYFFGIPRSGSYGGFATDIKADRVGIVHQDPAMYREIAQRIGANGSLAEGLTWDLMLSGDPGHSLSASSILTWANRAKVPIHAITADNIDAILPKIQTTEDVKSEIRNSVAAGMQVIIPEREFSQGKMQAAGYVILDPDTGGGIYRVDGGLNGAINWGCIAKAVILKVLCESKFIALVLARLEAFALGAAARLGLTTLLSAACPPLGVIFGIVNAVLIAVTIFQAAYEITQWVRQVEMGLIDLTPEEMAQAGIKAINDYACNYLPGCLSGIPGIGAANDWANEKLGYGGDSAPNGPTEGNPVSTGNGVKTETEVDYQGSGPFSLSYTRIYNSHLPNGSPVGHKWSADYQQRLVMPEGTTAMVAPQAVMAQRPDGGWRQFNNRAGVYGANGDVVERIERINDGLGRTTGWRLRTADDEIETYDGDGRLLYIENRTGSRQAMGYGADGLLETVTDDYGRRLRFEHDPLTRQVTALIDPSDRRTTYTYQSGVLVAVTYPDNTTRRYHYEVPGWPALLTGITDERGIRYANWKYDDQNRVTESSHAGGAERVTFAYGDLETKVTDTRGSSRTYRFTRIFDTLRMTESTEPCSGCGTGGAARITYDGNGNPYQITDRNGNVTQTTTNARGLPEQVVRAIGKPEAQSVSVSWHPTWRLPTLIAETGATGTARTTRLDYDSRGNLRQRTVTVDGRSRTWTFQFNAAGQIEWEDGPRTDVQDITRYEYDSATGNLALVRDPNGLETRYTQYDADGRVRRMVDPNGLATDYTYDARGRLAESRLTPAAGGQQEITGYRYTAYGALDRVTMPDGSWMEYGFDDAQRMTSVRDSRGNHVTYTLNAAGDREKQEVFDPDNRLAAVRHEVYDALGRLRRAYGGRVEEATEYVYDENGNERFVQLPLRANPTESRYDGLDRLRATIDPRLGSIQYDYDAQNNLRKVTDARQLETRYDYNGFNELETLTSPDTGVTRLSYDAAGNLASRSDARSLGATYTYDAGDRVQTATYPDETLRYTYDEATGGAGAKGRLTTQADGSGRTRYVYDAQGRIEQKIQQLGDDGNAAARRILAHHYEAGHLAESVLPSGARVAYVYGLDGRVQHVDVNGVRVVRDIEYFPFGEPKAWTTAAGRYQREFDTSGRVAVFTRGANNVRIGYDDAGRPATIDENVSGRPAWVFGYDDLDRLETARNTSASGPLASLGLQWSFDASGNRTRQVRTGGTAATTDYAIAPTSNRLANVDGNARNYDLAGNPTLVDGQTLVYSARGRLVEVRLGSLVQARYSYNGRSERVCAAMAGGTCPAAGVAGSNYQQFVYDQDSHLVGEYASDGALLAEHLWLGDTPLAVLKPAATAATYGGSLAGDVAVYFVQPDQLDTPRTIVNGSLRELWRWDSAPFGDTAANDDPDGAGAFAYRLRLPGQQFDAVTGTHYNYFRNYEADTGRYLESDPLGLVDGPNTYAYVANSPLASADVDGLAKPKPHGNCRNFRGPCHVYEIWGPRNELYKIGESCGGYYADGKRSKRCQRQANRLNALNNTTKYRCEVVFRGSSKGQVRNEETRRIKNARSCGCKLPGNKGNR